MSKKIIETTTFRKNLKKFKNNPTLLRNFVQSLELLRNGNHELLLDDHPLESIMAGKRAFSLGDSKNNLRVIYRISGNKIILLDVGGHRIYLRRRK